MEQDRSLIYTAILGVCAAASIAIVGRMVLYEPVELHRPHSPQRHAAAGAQIAEETAAEIAFSGAELTTLLRAALPEETPIGDIRLKPCADGTIEARGDLLKEKLETLVSGTPRTLLLLMPERCALRTVLSAGCDRETGELQLAVETIEAGGYGLPVQLSGLLSDQLTAAANQALTERGIHFTSIRISEDQVAFAL